MEEISRGSFYAFDDWERGVCDHFEKWKRDGVAADLDEAEQLLRRAAEHDPPEPMAYGYLGAIALAKGRPVEAMRWFRKADAAGSPNSEEPTAAELSSLRQSVWFAAENNDPEAQYEIAEWLIDGYGIQQNTADATAWLERAARQEFAPAIYKLGELNERAEGAASVASRAVALYRRAAERGDADAQYRLACLYEEGRCVPKDEAAVWKWLDQAAAQDHQGAMIKVVDLVFEAVGPDFAEDQLTLLQKCAARGYARAQYGLALWYGSEDLARRDMAQALYWLHRAAVQGDVWAEGRLGQWYRDGEGVDRNEKRAIQWLRRAAVRGDGEARLDLAFLLRRSDDADELREAAFWFLREGIGGSTSFDQAAGCYWFGDACEFGRGVSQSDALALRWYVRASECGHSEARMRVDGFCQAGRGLPAGDWVEAVDVLSWARRVGSAGAIKALERLRAQDPRAAAYSELHDLVGMEEVKKTVRDFIAKIRIDQMRGARGLRGPASGALHCVFSGPPGTGKTTVARVLGKLLGALGMLRSGHVKEVDRAGLIGKYVGETALKVEEVVQEAMGGVLFIDEAYGLSRSAGAIDYGAEAIDALVKRMEDYRTDLVVIVAGYEDEMETFLEANTGLESRFPWRFRFCHYSAPELFQLFQQFASRDGIRIDDKCASAALALATARTSLPSAFSRPGPSSIAAVFSFSSFRMSAKRAMRSAPSFPFMPRLRAIRRTARGPASELKSPGP